MKKILMTHLYWGDPNEDFSYKLATTLLDSGADMLEIGIPYTDPVCDGEVFQRACARALSGGMIPPKVLDGIQKLRDAGYRQPIYLTSYYGPIYKIGIEKTVQKAKKMGITGFIIPDLLLGEQGDLQQACKKHGLSIIQFATVYSSRERLRQICDTSSDFIYCIALPGVTGEKSQETDKLRMLIKTLKSLTDKPVYVGFGIQSAADAREIISFGADGVIVGSAIAKMYEKTVDHPETSMVKIATLVNQLKTVTINIR